MQNAAARVLRPNIFNMLHQFLNPYIGSQYVRKIDFKILLLTYKSLNGLGPSYITEMLSLYEPSTLLGSSGTSLLIVPRVKTKHGKAGFSYYVTNSWNKLPEDLRLVQTLTTFKSRLKMFMFTFAFC